MACCGLEDLVKSVVVVCWIDLVRKRGEGKGHSDMNRSLSYSFSFSFFPHPLPFYSSNRGGRERESCCLRKGEVWRPRSMVFCSRRRNKFFIAPPPSAFRKWKRAQLISPDMGNCRRPKFLFNSIWSTLRRVWNRDQIGDWSHNATKALRFSRMSGMLKWASGILNFRSSTKPNIL